MTAPKLQFDFSVNISLLIMLATIAIGAVWWVGSVNEKLSSLGAMVLQSTESNKRIGEIEKRIAIMDDRGQRNRETMEENRVILDRIEKATR